jgi:hypothetical protein
MSGRGLGLTGGTIDKLESIPGFKAEVNKENFIKELNEIGMVICSQTADLVPLDKEIYSLRDVTATVNSIPLIAVSIMSKKIASGADKILIDIKYGSGALIKDERSAKELKDQAISKALVEAAQAGEAEEKVEKTKIRFGFPRVVLALSCAAVVVFMIVYFVNLNMPDISLRVAAMQTGFEASYPSYVPRDYTLSGITSEEGNITLNFKNHSTETTFSLVEKKSTWDSNALLNNFVKSTYGENYSVIREQGLTIYISDSNATWVNGGVVYNFNAETSNLTKKQIKSIAVSL